MKYIYSFLFLVIVQTAFAQQVVLKKGMVTDNLIIADSTYKETFSIYLPSYYSKEKTWSVIFILDPKGRGRIVTQLFKQTAEEQGYILAASNNINVKNDLVANAEVSNRLIETVSSYFPINQKALYVVGLNEGAVAGMALSSVRNNIKGVLAIGDYWMNSKILKPGSGYSLIGLINYKDPDYYRLKEISSYISKIGYPTNIYRFDEEQEYPSADLIYSGISEFTLQRNKSNLSDTLSSNTVDPSRLFQHDIRIAENMRRQLNFYKAYQFLEVLENKYQKEQDQDVIDELKKQIKKNKIFKEQRRRYYAAATQEDYKITQYSYFLSEDLANVNFENLGYWSQQMKDLKEAQESGNIAEKELGYRLQGFLQNMAIQSYEELNKVKANKDLLVYTAILKTIFDKESPEGYFDIIAIAANDGDYPTALLYLEDLLKTGYKNMDSLYSISGTLDLKLSPEYNQLIRKYLGSAKFYNLKLNEQ